MDEKKQEQLNNLRHSTAHLLAAAIMQLYPHAKRAIGPAIENGFYFDFDFGDTKISEEDFPKIEAKMREILPSWEGFERHELTAEEAKKEYPDNPYKHELIDEFTRDGQKVSFYKSGAYWDLCKGGHSPHPKNDLKHFKLLSVAGAYWRGSEKNPMLTRIYGTVFPNKTGLEEYLTMMEEARKRDHKKLGKELDLFFFAETAPGMAYWLPKGLTLYNTLYGFARDMYKKFGYQEVATPQLNKKQLYETSGHWDHYKSDMFISPMSYLTKESNDPYEGSEVFGVKPMNCPNAMTIFAHQTRSYNDLPLRLGDTSLLHRFELSGTLNGLFRIRQFRQDDAHIFITQDHVQSEFESIMTMIEEMYRPFGITYKLRFGTRPEKALGEAKDWDFAETTLKAVLEKSGKEYFTVEGEGAFYGPKVDILMRDSLGREWQTGTVQLDIQQPKRFGLVYISKEGKEEMPFVFHRAILGSFERFLGILTEHYAGKFPVWLSPVQVILLPIADRHQEAAVTLYDALQAAGIRTQVNDTASTLQAKIRTATLQKIPFMGIIGDKETSSEGLLSIRTREGTDLGTLEISQFITKVKEDIDKKV
jgi:threonyl-tRNA synthetase